MESPLLLIQQMTESINQGFEKESGRILSCHKNGVTKILRNLEHKYKSDFGHISADNLKQVGMQNSKKNEAYNYLKMDH